MAGAWYLAIIIFGVYAEFLVRGSLIDHSSAQLTAENIMGNELLFRSGIVSDVICQLCHLFLIFHFYKMFSPVNKSQTLFMVSCVIISVGMTILNLMHHFMPLILLGDTSFLSSLSAGQLQDLGLLFMKLHGYGYGIAGVFFGLWLYPLGVLVNQSGAFPKILGWLLKLGCFGYLIEFIVVFLVPDLNWITYPGLLIALIAEFGFCFYLLIAGLNHKDYELAHS